MHGASAVDHRPALLVQCPHSRRVVPEPRTKHTIPAAHEPRPKTPTTFALQGPATRVSEVYWSACYNRFLLQIRQFREMRTRLPSFTPAVFACLALLFLSALLFADRPGGPTHALGSTPARAQAAPSRPIVAVGAPARSPAAPAGRPRFTQPQQVVRWAIAQIGTQPTLSAQIRQRVEAFGQTLVGSGQLLQANTGSHRVRLEMRFRVGSREGSIQQVCDGSRLWIYRQLADSSSIEVVDVRRLAQAAASAAANNETAGKNTTAQTARQALPGNTNPVAGRATAGPDSLFWSSLAIDGLAGYLRGLDRAFVFGTLEQTDLHGRPVWRLRGTWRPEALASRWPEAAQALSEGEKPRWSKLPEHLPHRVVVYIDRQNGLLHRVDFLRDPDTLLPWVNPQPKRLASIEWLGIETGVPLDDHYFAYDPGRQRPKDITQTYLERRGLPASPP